MRHNATRLTGGKPNSLGATPEVVAEVLASPETFDELLVPYLDRFLFEVAYIPQASTQWTLAPLLLTYTDRLSPKQRKIATDLLRRPLDREPMPAAWHDDWIVINMTLKTLQAWARDDDELREWLLPHLERLSTDRRKSVAGRAGKYLAEWG